MFFTGVVPRQAIDSRTEQNRTPDVRDRRQT